MVISISVLTTPAALEPINAPMWFRINSSSSNLTDFKYVFKPQYKIEPFGSSYTTLGTYKIPPRPTTGDGLFSANRVLKSFIENQSSPFTNGWASIGASLIDYTIKYGFEYNPNKAFTDTISVSGNMGLTFSTVHDFLTGDIITIDKTNKNYNPQYDGTCSVVSVPNAYSIKTDKVFSTTILAGESGNVTAHYRTVGTSSTCYTWNGTRQYDERQTSFLPYIMGTADGIKNNFLTNYDNSIAKPVRMDDYETLSLILPSSQLQPNYIVVKTYDSSNTLIQAYGITMSSNTYRRKDVGVGPMNLINAGIPFIEYDGSNVVDNYSVYIKNNPDEIVPKVGISETRRYKIDNQCTNYAPQRVMFLNRMGGWDYFTFTMDTKKSLTIARTEYEKMLNWNYSIGDKGKTILAQKAEVKMQMTSNWITEKESIWLEELLTSPEIYLLDNGVVYQNEGPIILTPTNSNFFTYLPAIGSYNVQFDVMRGDDLIIINNELVRDTIVYENGLTTHYTGLITMATTLFELENINNYGGDVIITNLVISKTSGNKLPIIITDTTYEVKTALRNQMFNLIANYKFAYDINLQNE